MLLASTLELAPPCWRQMLSLFLSIYHRHIITHGRRHQIHDGGSWTAPPGSSTDHQRPIERGVDGSAAPVGPAFTARHFASVIAREGRVSPPIPAAFPPSCLCFLSSNLPLHTHTARFLLPLCLCTNTGLFIHPLLAPVFRPDCNQSPLQCVSPFSFRFCRSSAPMVLHPWISRQTTLEKSNFTAKCAIVDVTFNFFGDSDFSRRLWCSEVRGLIDGFQTFSSGKKEGKRSIYYIEFIG